MSRLLRELFGRLHAPDPAASGGTGGAPAGGAPGSGAAPGAAASGDGAKPGAAGGAAPSGAAAGAGDGSVLGDGKAAASADDKVAAIDDKAKDPNAWIPEKYRVFEGEGDAKKLNLEASAQKLAAAHGELEKRAGQGGLPPEKADDYKVTLPDDAPFKADDLDQNGLKAFRAAAHGAKLTQAQFDVAMGAHVAAMRQFVEDVSAQGKTLCETELKTDPAWQDPKTYSGNLKLAYRTFAAFATPAEAAEIDRIGNNPLFLKILARAGAHLGEDRLARGPGVGSMLTDDTLEKYLAPGSPYYDPTHPEHKKAVDIVTRHFNAKHGGARPVTLTQP